MLRAVKQKFDYYYINLEEFVTRNETNEDVKINKKMLIFYTHCLAVYFALSYFFNPLMTLSKFLGLQLYVVGQFLALLTRNYTIMAGSYILSALVSLYGCSVNPYDGLKSIAIALIQHNYSFLLNKNKLLKLLFVIVSMALVNKSQTYVQEMLDQNNFEVIQHLILNLQYAWPTLYIINTISILYLTNKYWQAFQEKQEAQKALESKNQELSEVNQKLQATLKLLEQTNKDLKDAMSARELFIASVSHELRNPLNSMLGNIELLSLDVKEPKCQSMLDSCKICGEVLLGLINNVLDVAKINAEKLELHIESENLHRVIEKVWIMSTIKMRQKGIKGQLLIGNNVPKHVEIDAYRLNQILLNLIGNATKFTQKGFVRVIVSWAKNGTLEQLNEANSELIPSETRNSSRIDLKADILRQVRLAKNQDLKTEEFDTKSTGKQAQGHALNRIFSAKTFSHLQSSMNYTHFDETDSKIQQKLLQFSPLSLCHKGVLKIEVTDSGCGIAATDLQRLFHPFSQADSSITAKFGGTGLGLYITKQLVQKMDGQIHVESQKNVGSNFWIGIPINTGRENQIEISFKKETNKSFPLISNLNNMKALIVDDDPFNQLILINYLNKLNIQSEVANNGQEALEKFKRRGPNTYSFIITDIEMPIMDGLSACKAIRRYEQQMKIATSCPIAIVTANSSDPERTQCLNPEGEIRAHSFFRKPFTFEECQAFIKNLTHY